MKTRLYNARILSMVDGQDIFHGEIHIDGNTITYVGPSQKRGDSSAKGPDPVAEKNVEILGFDQEIDCHGNLLMPGFKNAHAHSGMSELRSLADDKPLHQWLNEDVFPREAKMSAEDVYWTSQLSVLEYLTSGITACMDMYMYQDTVAKAMDDMGFRCVQVGSGNDFDKDITYIDGMYNKYKTHPQPLSAREGSSMGESAQDSNHIAPSLQGGRGVSLLQTYQLGFHAEYTTCLDNLKKVAWCVKKNKAPLFVHACETASEVDGCVERYGMTTVSFLASLGMFDYGGGIYHGIYMSEEDFKTMKEKGMYVVTNPGSNTKLASGVCPISEYMKRGIPVAIGTDGPASNNCLDMFREMFLVTGLAKLREHDAAFLDAMDVLKMATVNGAHCMLLDDCDVLAVGKKADIIMIDLHQPNMQPLNNIAKNIVYSGSKQNVKMTMIDGRILYLDGKFLYGNSPEVIYEKVEAIKNRILSAQ